jgi:hypothetical protein
MAGYWYLFRMVLEENWPDFGNEDMAIKVSEQRRTIVAVESGHGEIRFVYLKLGVIRTWFFMGNGRS